jgi:hypothetical protein
MYVVEDINSTNYYIMRLKTFWFIRMNGQSPMNQTPGLVGAFLVGPTKKL